MELPEELTKFSSSQLIEFSKQKALSEKRERRSVLISVYNTVRPNLLDIALLLQENDLGEENLLTSDSIAIKLNRLIIELDAFCLRDKK
jgi:hypothetical protein